MKIPFNKAADDIQLHPCELILELAKLAKSFDEVYPEADEGLIETVKQMQPNHFIKSLEEDKTQVEIPMTIPKRLLDDATRIVSVLSAKKFWGKNTIPQDIVRTRLCRGIEDFDSIIKELARREILLLEKSSGPISLNPKKKAEIEPLIN